VAVVVVLVAIVAAVSLGFARRSHDPVARDPDDAVALTVIPATIRSGQPFIVTVRTGGDVRADGSEVHWFRPSAITWQVMRGGHWVERFVLTTASRLHPPSSLPGDIGVSPPAVRLGAVTSSTFEAPEAAAGTYRICTTVFEESPPATARTEHRSCALIVVAPGVKTTS
jgi:hypothetical protein